MFRACPTLTGQILGFLLGLAIVLFECQISLGEQGKTNVVVLKNGNILQGEVRQQGDYVSILLAGGEFRVRREQVEVCCADLDEAYQRRLSTISSTNADAHLKLARWCLRQGLLKHAASELETTRRIEPRHEHIPLLERQLVQLVKTQCEKKRID